MTTVSFLSGWKIESYDKNLHISLDGSPGYITITQADEGFVVDIWPDVGNESAGSTYALFSELEPE